MTEETKEQSTDSQQQLGIIGKLLDLLGASRGVKELEGATPVEKKISVGKEQNEPDTKILETKKPPETSPFAPASSSGAITIDMIEKMSPTEINKNWAEVSKVLTQHLER